MLPHLEPTADEGETIRWLTEALGQAIMDQHGGGWRTAIREHKRAVVNACYEFRLRSNDPILMPLRNPGGWLRDKFNRLKREFEEVEG